MYIAIVLNVLSLIGMVAGVLMHSGRGGGLSDMFGGAGTTALGSSDDEDEEHEHLTTHVVECPREGHEGERDGVEHQLDAHEHDQRVAADQQSDRSDREDHRGQHQVPGGGERYLDLGQHHRDASSRSSGSVSSAPDPGSAPSAVS